MEIGTSKIYNDLPSVICKRSSSLMDLPAQKNAEELSKKREFKDLIQSLLPDGDKDEIDTQLRKGFLLTQKRQRKIPESGKKKIGKANGMQHRGKKRLSGRERRELGLHKIDKNNKTFEMFLPINDMWKSYSKDLLGIEHYIKGGWKGGYNDSRTDTIQNKLRRIEYFGCLVRVTKSRCSEFVGTTGIIIKETKNTFVMICPDDRVKTIPKLHSEFSFVIQDIGFSISGNHLHQRSVERAKNNFKKLQLWL